MYTFNPWIGKQYKTGGIFKGKKLLILGESHYGYEDENLNATTETVKRYLKNENTVKNNWKRFFTSITKICMNVNKLNQEDKVNFWESIVFYNYLWTSLINGCSTK